MIDSTSWMTVYPEIVLLVMACVIALVDLLVTSPKRTVTYVLSLVSSVAWLYCMRSTLIQATHFTVLAVW